MTEPDIQQQANSWSCQSCTYLNDAADAECMLCNTARSKADDKVGGVEFSRRFIHKKAKSIKLAMLFFFIMVAARLRVLCLNCIYVWCCVYVCCVV